MQFKDTSRLCSTIGICVGILGVLLMSLSDAQAQPDPPNHGPIKVRPNEKKTEKIGRDASDVFGNEEVTVEPGGVLVLDGSEAPANRRPAIVKGTFKNKGVMIFKGRYAPDFRGPAGINPGVVIENDGLMVFTHDEKEIDHSNTGGGGGFARGGGTIKAMLGSLTILDGGLNGNLNSEGTVMVGQAPYDLSGIPDSFKLQRLIGRLQTPNSRTARFGDYDIFYTPVASLFSINGNLSLSSGEAVVNINYNSTTNRVEYGQFNVAGNVYINGAELIVNVDSTSASLLNWTTHLPIIIAKEIFKSSTDLTNGEFGSWIANGLSGSGKRLGHRAFYRAGNGTNQEDFYLIDVLTYTSTQKRGSDIIVRGDFTDLPTASEFRFHNNIAAATNPSYDPANTTETTQIRVRVPDASTTGPLRWTNTYTLNGFGNPVITAPTVTFNNFTPTDP